MSRPTAITGPLAACVEHAGGVAALAEALGVSRWSIARWQTTPPSVAVRRHVNGWATRRGLAEPFPGA